MAKIEDSTNNPGGLLPGRLQEDEKMKAEEILKLALGHEKLRVEDIARLRRAKRRQDRTCSISPRPEIPLNVTIHFSSTNKEAARVFDKRIIGMTRRDGPRQTKK
jgi:hypothetical protein